MYTKHFLQPKNWSRGSYLDRFEFIKPHISNKSVLDLGCTSGYKRADWLHEQVCSVASRVVGVDIGHR